MRCISNSECGNLESKFYYKKPVFLQKFRETKTEKVDYTEKFSFAMQCYTAPLDVIRFHGIFSSEIEMRAKFHDFHFLKFSDTC